MTVRIRRPGNSYRSKSKHGFCETITLSSLTRFTLRLLSMDYKAFTGTYLYLRLSKTKFAPN